MYVQITENGPKPTLSMDFYSTLKLIYCWLTSWKGWICFRVECDIIIHMGVQIQLEEIEELEVKQEVSGK